MILHKRKGKVQIIYANRAWHKIENDYAKLFFQPPLKYGYGIGRIEVETAGILGKN